MKINCNLITYELCNFKHIFEFCEPIEKILGIFLYIRLILKPCVSLFQTYIAHFRKRILEHLICPE